MIQIGSLFRCLEICEKRFPDLGSIAPVPWSTHRSFKRDAFDHRTKDADQGLAVGIHFRVVFLGMIDDGITKILLLLRYHILLFFG